MIILKGKTLHGKNRVKEHGVQWTKMENTISPLRKGEISIISVKTGDERWVHPSIDPNFEVKEK